MALAGDTGLVASRGGDGISGMGSSSMSSPYPSPPVWRTDGILRPEIFWNPRSPVVELRVDDDVQRPKSAPAPSGVSLERWDVISGERGP
jgi:hypothetical protein